MGYAEQRWGERTAAGEFGCELSACVCVCVLGDGAERSAWVSRSMKAGPGIRARWKRRPGLETSGCPPQERVGAPGLARAPLRSSLPCWGDGGTADWAGGFQRRRAGSLLSLRSHLFSDRLDGRTRAVSLAKNKAMGRGS